MLPLVTLSERTFRQAITQVAAALFERDAAERVVVAGMPKAAAAMHLDTVFTFADRDIVTVYPAGRGSRSSPSSGPSWAAAGAAATA